MAHVEKRGKSYSVCYRYTDDRGIEHKKRISGFSTKEDAAAAMKDLQQKTDRGIDVHGGELTTGTIMERWFSERSPFLAATTRAKYSDAIDRLSRTFIYTTKIKRMNNQTYNTLLSDLQSGVGGKRQITLRTAFTLTEPLRLSISWAFASGIIPDNPIASCQKPRTEKRQQIILSDHDIKSLKAAADDSPFRIPLLLALYGGLRREEAAALTWDCVDFTRNTITVKSAITRTSHGKEIEKQTKTDLSSRTVTMPRFVMDVLRDSPKTSNRVCTSRTGQPYRLDSYSESVSRLAQRINASRLADPENTFPPMPIPTYHDLRHTHAAMCIRMGIQPKVIQERLGHASIKITMDLYGYLMPGLQQSVADAFDADYT